MSRGHLILPCNFATFSTEIFEQFEAQKTVKIVEKVSKMSLNDIIVLFKPHFWEQLNSRDFKCWSFRLWDDPNWYCRKVFQGLCRNSQRYLEICVSEFLVAPKDPDLFSLGMIPTDRSYRDRHITWKRNLKIFSISKNLEIKSQFSSPPILGIAISTLFCDFDWTSYCCRIMYI